jgi:hypothetical protein
MVTHSLPRYLLKIFLANMYIGIMMLEVIITSIQVLKFRASLMKPAKNKLTRPSRLYKIMEFRLKRFIWLLDFKENYAAHDKQCCYGDQAKSSVI